MLWLPHTEIDARDKHRIGTIRATAQKYEIMYFSGSSGARVRIKIA
jgi:hypothetical protein